MFKIGRQTAIDDIDNVTFPLFHASTLSNTLMIRKDHNVSVMLNITISRKKLDADFITL